MCLTRQSPPTGRKRKEDKVRNIIFFKPRNKSLLLPSAESLMLRERQKAVSKPPEKSDLNS